MAEADISRLVRNRLSDGHAQAAKLAVLCPCGGHHCVRECTCHLDSGIGVTKKAIRKRLIHGIAIHMVFECKNIVRYSQT